MDNRRVLNFEESLVALKYQSTLPGVVFYDDLLSCIHEVGTREKSMVGSTYLVDSKAYRTWINIRKTLEKESKLVKANDVLLIGIFVVAQKYGMLRLKNFSEDMVYSELVKKYGGVYWSKSGDEYTDSEIAFNKKYLNM